MQIKVEMTPGSATENKNRKNGSTCMKHKVVEAERLRLVPTYNNRSIVPTAAHIYEWRHRETQFIREKQ